MSISYPSITRVFRTVAILFVAAGLFIACDQGDSTVAGPETPSASGDAEKSTWTASIDAPDNAREGSIVSFQAEPSDESAYSYAWYENGSYVGPGNFHSNNYYEPQCVRVKVYITKNSTNVTKTAEAKVAIYPSDQGFPPGSDGPRCLY